MRTSRLAVAIAVVLLALALASVLALWPRAPGAPAPGRVTAAPPPGASPPSPAPAPAPGPATAPPAPAAPLEEGPDPLGGLADPYGPWEDVDLEAVRDAMPDNLYWRLGAPTQDPRVQSEREAERARWNVEYGKVLSNTASEEEIRAYYAHRQRLSADYIEFASHLLQHYGETLPPRDVRLLEFAIELHLARLEEIPRQIEEAIARHEAHEAARQAWLEQQAAFGEEAEAPPE